MAKHYVLCTQDYIHVIPETTISGIDLPKNIFQYTKGQKLVFDSFKSAKNFITTHAGIFKLITIK